MKKVELSIGNDNGNSSQKLMINGEIIVQPNVYSKVRKLPNQDEMAFDYLVDHLEDYIIASIESGSVNDGLPATYLVANHAIKSGEPLMNMEVKTGITKLMSHVPVINTNAQIACYAAKQVLKEDPSETEICVDVFMTTALPVLQHTKENSKKFADQFYGKNKNKVTLHIKNHKVEVTINYRYIKVLHENVGPVFYLQESLRTGKDTYKNLRIFDEFSKRYGKKVDGNYFKNKKILFVGPGEGTCEWVVTNDIQYDPHLIDGSYNGLGHATQKILPEFKETYRLDVFSRQDFSEAFKSTSHRYHAAAKDFISIGLENEANEILHKTDELVMKAKNDIDVIVVHGGSSIAMYEQLANKLYERYDGTGIEILYVPKEYAVQLEVYGLYAFTESQIFETLKQKHLSKEVLNIG